MYISIQPTPQNVSFCRDETQMLTAFVRQLSHFRMYLLFSVIYSTFILILKVWDHNSIHFVKLPHKFMGMVTTSPAVYEKRKSYAVTNKANGLRERGLRSGKERIILPWKICIICHEAKYFMANKKYRSIHHTAN